MLTFLQNLSKFWPPTLVIYTIFTLGLAIFDNLVLIQTIIHHGISYWIRGPTTEIMGITTDVPVDIPITAPICNFAFMGNGYLTVLMCVERFVMIMYPEKSKIWCSKQKTIVYICVAFFISLLNAIPDFFAYSWDENGKVNPTDFYNKYWIIVLRLRLLNPLTCITIMLILSTIIAIKVSLQFFNIGWN